MTSNQFAIVAEDISKIYRIGRREEKIDSLAASTWNFLRRPLENYRKYRSLYDFSDVLSSPDRGRDREDILWALDSVGFSVRPGEVVGIVGANGAGKTTLLKILARISPPTTGKVSIHGRVGSLLEVGTGFHPELTGRENVYLNGTVLGMRKTEVDRKFDEIINFSGVEKFLDTPVKRYSVGMRVRLAFAVAAHLEPEILIIDEVLAVGDAEFQKKCLNKMEDVGQEGRTVLFVSHNMSAVTRLCPRAILLEDGRVAADGPAKEVVSRYLRAGSGSAAERRWEDIQSAPGDSVVRLCSVTAVNQQGIPAAAIDIREKIGLRMTFQVQQDGHLLFPNFLLVNEESVRVFTTIDVNTVWGERPRPAGYYTATAWIPGNLLADGTYYVRATMRTPDRNYRPFNEGDVIAFNVIDSMEGGTARGSWVGVMTGVVRPKLEWNTDYTADTGGPIHKVVSG